MTTSYYKLILATVVLLLIIIAANTFAAIYMYKDRRGNTVYSDTPNAKSEVVNLPDATPAASSTTTTTTTTTTQAKSDQSNVAPEVLNPPIIVQTGEVRKDYTTFMIVNPKDQETIQNQPIISVSIDLKPELQKGDRVQVLLDSKPFGEPVASTDLQLSLVDRGTHQLSAVIIDTNGTIVKQTPSITIYVHRASAALRPVNI